MLKIGIWLSLFLIFYIIFSLNTLISIFCFIIVIFIIAFLLLQLHVEYVTYLFLLLYLGGILIFFLFTSLMLHKEYQSFKVFTLPSWDNFFVLIFMSKFFFFWSCLNLKLCCLKNTYLLSYSSCFIENDFFFKELFNNQSDLVFFISLYTEKAFVLFLLGMILLFTLMGVIVITKK